MIFDPHESYNPNFLWEDWQAYQKHAKTLELAEKVRGFIDSGLVAVINHSLLCDINFDVRSRVDYGAAILQESYYPHWAALAISMLTHACFEPNYEQKVTRFYKSQSPNPIKYPPNIEWMEDELGREHAVWKGTVKKEKMKQLEMFEF